MDLKDYLMATRKMIKEGKEDAKKNENQDLEKAVGVLEQVADGLEFLEEIKKQFVLESVQTKSEIQEASQAAQKAASDAEAQTEQAFSVVTEAENLFEEIKKNQQPEPVNEKTETTKQKEIREAEAIIQKHKKK